MARRVLAAWTFAALLLLLVLAAPARAQARSITGLRHPGDAEAWVFEQGGQRIGHCVSRYAGEVELAGLRAHRFDDEVAITTEIQGTALELRNRCELLTDTRARPLRARLELLVNGHYSSVDAVFADGKAQATIRQAGKERTVTVDAPEGCYLLANNFLSHIELVLAFEAPAAGETRQVTLFSADALVTLPYELTADGEPDADGGRVIKDSLGEILRLDQGGHLLACEVPAQKMVLRRVEETFEPVVIERPRPRARADLEREEVRIDDGDVSLAGTLTRPKGAEGPLPGVVFVSGSGGQDRDGISGAIDVGTHEILDRVTQAGFSVLRVDDRGVGESTGPTRDMTYDDLVEDARRCVDYLRGRVDVVDPERIVLIGHSEGGETVPILAASEPGVAAIVLLAAPARPIGVLSTEQLVAAKQRDGVEGEALEAYAKEVRAFFDAVASGSEIDGEALPEELKMLLAVRPWLASHAKVDPLANIAKVRCPVLVLQGERDIQVSPERDAQALEAALDAAHNPDHELVVFPGLDHLFKQTVGETSSGLDYLRDRPVAPEVLDKLCAWLTARVK